MRERGRAREGVAIGNAAGKLNVYMRMSACAGRGRGRGRDRGVAQ